MKEVKPRRRGWFRAGVLSALVGRWDPVEPGGGEGEAAGGARRREE